MKFLKRLNIILCTAVLTGLLAACSSEPVDEPTGDKVSVTVRLSARSQSGAGTRAWSLDPDNGEDGEMMNSWFVVIVQEGYIKSIVTSDSYSGEKESDTFVAQLDPGETTFYSFANINPKDIGIDTSASLPAALPTGFDTQYYDVAGNVMTAKDFADGIPMSNKQTFTVSSTNRVIDLETIRMVAKMKITLHNSTDDDLSVKSLTLNDIVYNKSGVTYLLPQKQTVDGVETLIPHIDDGEPDTYGDYEITDIDGNGGSKTLAPDETVALTFYVNESIVESSQYFVMTIETDDDDPIRYAMLDWNQIVRNDYRIIPVVRLCKYRLSFNVTSFSPIGVVPTVEDSYGTLKVTLHNYGEFHIQPVVRQSADSSPVSYGTSGWQFVSGEELTFLEADPEQGTSKWIFDTDPWVNTTTGCIEAVAGRRNGMALYRVKVIVDGVVLSYKLEIHTDIKY